MKNAIDLSLMKQALDYSTEDIYATREDGTMFFCNRNFRAHHEIDDDTDVTTMKIYDLPSYSRNKEQWEAHVQRIKERERNGSAVKQHIVYNPLPLHPEIIATESSSFWVHDEDGTNGMLWSFSHDISDRILQEERVRQYTQVMNKVLEYLPAGIVVKDINNGFKYLYRNRASYKMKGSNPENAIGKDDFDFHSLEDATRKRKQDEELAATGKEMHWIDEQCDSDGNIYFMDKRKIKIEGDDFSPMLLSIDWDITELELMKRELIAAKEKAETSDKLKSAFLANMSHEIRTPLNAIVGFSRIIAESSDPEERLNYYNIVESNNDRLLQLINEILDLSKIESGLMEFHIVPVRLHLLCKEVRDAHLLRCPDGVQLVYEPSDERVIIDADKTRLFQVISNLIGNAFKFTTEGSISYGYHREGNRVIFHVTDTGKGIDPDKLDKVFDRFVKANSFVQGFGLGLSISRAFIEHMGGTISVTSEVGKGTTFTFNLPVESAEKETDPQETEKEIAALPQEEIDTVVADSPGNAETRSVPLPRSSQSDMLTILIAEDTDSNYILAKAILSRFYHLERARDGMEAVTMFEDLHPDIILMDMRMPNLDGLDATRIIRELDKEVPIIALTAYAFDHDRQAALDAGCNDFLTKPFTQEQLKSTVSKWLTKEGK